MNPPLPAPVLALLDVGATEFLLLVGLFLILFGADKVPEMARTVGRWTAQIKRTAGSFQKELDRERGLADRPGDAVPRAQYQQVEDADRRRLRELQEAARALGISPEGKGEQELKQAIAGKVQR